MQWLEVVYEMGTSVLCFSKVLKVKFRCKWIFKFLRRLKEGLLEFLSDALTHNFEFNNRCRNIGNRYLKPFFKGNFRKNSIETIRLLAFDFYEVIVG